MLDIETKLLTSFHSQNNGKTEQMDQKLVTVTDVKLKRGYVRIQQELYNTSS